MEKPAANFFNLSALLEQQLDTVLANQRLLLAMHETLKHLLPKYETEVVAALEAQHQPKKEPREKERQESNRMWEANAKKTLLELRSR